jgi:cobalamin biosynthetic protein CobC
MRDDNTPVPSSPTLPHGGDLSAAEALYGPPAQGWVDLSTGINPTPYPVGDIGGNAFSRLPEKAAMDDLLEAAQAYYAAPSLGTIVAAPGTQALIQWLPRLRPRSTVSVISPTYGEHAHAWCQAGHDVVEAAAPDQAPEDTDVLVVVNPNNPDGTRYTPEELLETGQRLALQGGWLIVDEAFGDVTPGLSLAAHCQQDGIILLRSFGKFFGLAGLRLGFALTSPEMAGRLNRALGPWAVAGPACEIGARALRDKAWIEQTRAALAAGRRRLEALLVESGLDITGGTDLFTTARTGRAGTLHGHLAGAGIWTRIFPNQGDWIRFGQPGTDEHWRRLDAALKSWPAEI